MEEHFLKVNDLKQKCDPKIQVEGVESIFLFTLVY